MAYAFNDDKSKYDLQTIEKLLAGNYDGSSLVEKFSDEISNFGDEWEWLQSRMQNNNFDGLLIGDYIDVTINDLFGTYTMRYRIGAIDPYYMCGDGNSINKHHVAMVPDQVARTDGSYAVNTDRIQWNTTANNNGKSDKKHPYLCSQLHEWENGVFGLPYKVRRRIMEGTDFLEERYSAAGAQTSATGTSWASIGNIWSPSCIEVFGHESFGSKGFSDGISCQFPIFKITKNRIKYTPSGNVAGWWLRTPSGTDSTRACRVTDNGIASVYQTNFLTLYALPCFFIG